MKTQVAEETRTEVKTMGPASFQCGRLVMNSANPARIVIFQKRSHRVFALTAQDQDAFETMLLIFGDA